MKASEGEKIRLDHQIENLRGLIRGLEETYTHGWPATESAQAVADAAARVLTHAARFDAFKQAEQAQREREQEETASCTRQGRDT